MNHQVTISDVQKICSFEKFLVNTKVIFSGLTEKLQDATSTDICIYKLKNYSSRDLFESRLLECKSLIVFVLDEGKQLTESDRVKPLSEDDFLVFYDRLIDLFYPLRDGYKSIGVTGTNGKSTVIDLIRQIGSLSNLNVVSIGTLGIKFNEDVLISDTGNTTPSLLLVKKVLSSIKETIDIIAIEVSSHSIDQRRLLNWTFDAIVWTSFSQDHLDYHKTMDYYFSSKMLLRDIHSDNLPFLVPANCPFLKRFELGEFLEVSRNPICNKVHHNKFFDLAHNIENLSLAMETFTYLGFKIDDFSIDMLTPPRGRFDLIAIEDNKLVAIDYAHTPDAIINICRSIRESFKNYKFTIVFGCGGDRDRSKRPIMGKAACLYTDKVIVTSDNPRTEDPDAIIDEVVREMNRKYLRFENRSLAISHALENIEDFEIILIAGKGHEEYQDIKGIKHPFSDFDVVYRFIEDHYASC